MTTAQVYVNWGRIVAECWCGDAREVEPGQPTMVCCVGDGSNGHYCPGHVSDLEWPDNMPAIMAALAERTHEKRKNWFPTGHPMAVAGGYPHNQTPDELRAEAAIGEAADAQTIADRKAQLLAQLRELATDKELIDDIAKGI